MKNSIVSLPLAAVLAISVSGPAWAAEDQQMWTTASATVKLNDDWKISQEVTARFSDTRNGLYEIEAVTMANFRVAKNVTVAAGYVHDPQYAGGDFTIMERRAREQVTFDNIAELAGGKLSARMRMEQRWRENVDGTGWRARPYVKYSLPIRGKNSLTISSETFVNLNTTPFQKQSGLDRMRNFIGVNTPLAKNLTAEIGYLNQHGFVRGGEDTSDHVASLAVSLSL